MKAAILTLSDKGARGERADASGPALEKWLDERGVRTLHTELIPDDEETIVVKLMGWADSGIRPDPHHRRHRGIAARRHPGGDRGSSTGCSPASAK